MKHLLTAIACCLAVAGSAQAPYNPDSDGNNLMGAEDLMSLLSLYGGEFYPEFQSPVLQTCAQYVPDTCWVDEETDIFLYSSFQALVLPNDSSFKRLTIMPMNQGSIAAILEITDYPYQNHVYINAARDFFRSPLGYWSTHDWDQ